MRLLSIADGLLRRVTEDIEVAGTTIRAATVSSWRPRSSVATRTSAPTRTPWTGTARPATTSRSVSASTAAAGVVRERPDGQCLGQNLARAELEIALRALFDRLPKLRLAAPAHAFAWKPGDTVQGMLELLVTW